MSGKHPMLDAVNFGTATLRGAFAASLLALWLAGCGSDGMTKVSSDGAGGSTPGTTSDGSSLDTSLGTTSVPDGSTIADAGPDMSITFPDAATALCGNGVVESGEKCDPAAKDEASRCPSVCPVQNCMTYKLVNKDSCQAQCIPDVAQTTCSNGDKCCPAGCNANTDDDCQAICGNNVQEPTETCDPLTNCPKSCPQDRCNMRKLEGSGTCKAACQTTQTITQRVNGDNCCPAGATYENDKDCEMNCDNGIVEGNETCDPRESCPKSCPNIACQKYELKNDGTCRAACVATEKIVACVNGDGCCAPGCNANNDSDCPAQCGNGVIEKDEICEPGSAHDCPTTCPMIECMTRQLVGDKCQAHCEASGVLKA